MMATNMSWRLLTKQLVYQIKVATCPINVDKTRAKTKQNYLKMSSFDLSMRNVAKMQVCTGVFKRSDNEVVNKLDMGHSGCQTMQTFADVTQKQMNDKNKEDTINHR